MQQEPAPRYMNQGDSALLVYLGQGIDPLLNRRVRALAAALAEKPLAGVREVLGGYHCLQVQFDLSQVEPAQVQSWAAETLAALPEPHDETPRVVEVPVVYSGEHGPDLDFVASHTGLKPREVIERHSGRDYPCYVVGFSPAFPFLGGMDPALACPRLDSPRLDVPPGSVGIGGAQTGFYTIGGPGGWRVIGRTPLLVYDPRRDPPGLIRAGDHVRFKAIHAADFPEIPQATGSLPEPGREVMEVIKPGAFTTVQDRGRWGYQYQGLPVCGALDQTSLAAANILVGNPPHAAALELTLLGPKLKALAPLKIALAGADLAPSIDGKPVPMGRAVQMQPGQILDFKGPKGGARAVLAIEGGVWSPVMIGSRSVYPLGRLGQPLQKGQRISAGRPSGLKGPDGLPAGLIPAAQSPAEIRVLAGPNPDYFTDEGLATFFSAEYRLTQETDRRGMRLMGPQVELDPEMPDSILSEPNTPGVIQVPAGGQPIIQLNEQTVGGYAKIATVISADLDILARLLPGSRLSFKRVSLADAVAAARARSRALASLAEQT